MDSIVTAVNSTVLCIYTSLCVCVCVCVCVYVLKVLGVPQWLSKLRIQHRHGCGEGLIPGQGTSAFCDRVQPRGKKMLRE